MVYICGRKMNSTKMKKLFLTLVLVSWAFVCGMAQKSTVQKMMDESRNNPRAEYFLDILTGRFGGRLIGSDAFENAQQWMAREFKKWGVEVRLEEVGELPFGFNRGPWFGRAIGAEEFGLRDLHFVTPSYTSGTHGIQMGHVVLEPKTEQELEKMKGTLKGAWVLISGTSNGMAISRSPKIEQIRNNIKAENKEIAERNAQKRREAYQNGTSYVPEEIHEYPALFYKEMVEAGVLGFIQSSKVPLTALYDRDMIDEKLVTDFDSLPTIPDIKLDEYQYDIIKKLAQERRRFWLEFDIRNHFKLGPVKYHNLVAEIKGTKYPDEYVIACGHLDAYDAGTGAVDCGTGITPLLEMARLLAVSGAKPKRTIRFVATAAEEFGIWGADGYCLKHSKELDKICCVFNRDYGIEPPVGVSVPDCMYDDFVKVSRPLVEASTDQWPFAVSRGKAQRKPTRLQSSDYSAFAMRGVPTVDFTCKDVYGLNFTYGEIWHTERDILNKQNGDYMQRTALVTAIELLGIANLDHQLSRQGFFEGESK